MVKIPFGEFKDFKQCVLKNQDKENPEGYCAMLHKNITGRYPNQKESGVNFGFRDSLEYMHKTMTRRKDRLKEDSTAIGATEYPDYDNADE